MSEKKDGSISSIKSTLWYVNVSNGKMMASEKENEYNMRYQHIDI